jgi:ribosomal protein S18 acetylase RimI-like enzyme
MFEIRNDSWLSKIFSYPVFQVKLKGEINRDFAKSDIKDKLAIKQKMYNKAFYYSKTPVSDISSASLLEDLNFHLVDTSTQYSIKKGALNTEKIVQGNLSDINVVCLKNLRREFYDNVLNIASTSFVFSRFHLDPYIDNKLAGKVKRVWVKNYFAKKRGSDLLVAFFKGMPVGFIAILMNKNERKRTIIIELMAVKKKFQRSGVGKKLISELFRLYKDKCDIFHVGTQISNTPSNKFYMDCGFRISSSYYVFHKHVGIGKNYYDYR